MRDQNCARWDDDVLADELFSVSSSEAIMLRLIGEINVRLFSQHDLFRRVQASVENESARRLELAVGFRKEFLFLFRVVLVAPTLSGLPTWKFLQDGTLEESVRIIQIDSLRDSLIVNLVDAVVDHPYGDGRKVPSYFVLVLLFCFGPTQFQHEALDHARRECHVRSDTLRV